MCPDAFPILYLELHRVPGTQQAFTLSFPVPCSYQPVCDPAVRLRAKTRHTHASDIIRSQLHARWAYTFSHLELCLPLAVFGSAVTAVGVLSDFHLPMALCDCEGKVRYGGVGDGDQHGPVRTFQPLG